MIFKMASLCRNSIVRQCHIIHLAQRLCASDLLARHAHTVGRNLLPTVCSRLDKEVQIPQLQQRAIHLTKGMLKKHKFDPHLYERVNVLDYAGHFVIECEMLVLIEFCTKFSRFTYEKLEVNEANERTGKPHVNPDHEVYQLKEKRALDEDSKDRKTVKMNMKELVTFKVEKVIQELFNHGSVTLQYRPVRLLLTLSNTGLIYSMHFKDHSLSNSWS